MMMQIEKLVLNPAKVPPWAKGAEAVDTGRTDYEVWELHRDGRLIGYAYDDGGGYQFAEGEHNVPAYADEPEGESR